MTILKNKWVNLCQTHIFTLFVVVKNRFAYCVVHWLHGRESCLAWNKHDFIKAFSRTCFCCQYMPALWTSSPSLSPPSLPRTDFSTLDSAITWIPICSDLLSSRAFQRPEPGRGIVAKRIIGRYLWHVWETPGQLLSRLLSVALFLGFRQLFVSRLAFGGLVLFSLKR